MMGRKLHEKCNTLSILLVEDYLPLQQKIAAVLSDYFGTVNVASDGQEGLALYEDFHAENNRCYDLVMTDYDMPKLNGIDLIKAIKKEHTKQMFIVISAYQKPQQLIEFINLGVMHFLAKPIRPGEMLAVFEKASDMILESSALDVVLGEDLVWNHAGKTLHSNAEEIKLSKYDILLLEVLVRSLNTICSNETILSYFYLQGEDVEQENIRNMINRLRKKIPSIAIESTYGVGYRLSSL